MKANDKKLTSCCEKAEDLRIRWRKADKWEGPEDTGWSMPSGADYDGNDNYVNINFCPWCGSKLDLTPSGTPGSSQPQAHPGR